MGSKPLLSGCGEAHTLDEFRELWIETSKRRDLIDHLLGDNFSPEVIREIDKMSDFDLYDFFGHHPARGDPGDGAHRRSATRQDRL